MYDAFCLLCSQCKLCGRDGTITMIPGQGTPLTIEQSQKGEKACLMVFDCRGYEPVEFSFSDGWMAESVSVSWSFITSIDGLLLMCNHSFKLSSVDN
jgi:hypothetical protein